MLSGQRRLCMGVDIVAWSRRSTATQREDLQHRLLALLITAAAEADTAFDDWHLQPAGDGALIVLPGTIDEARTIAALLRVLSRDLTRHNDTEPPECRLRARLSLGQGILRENTLGYSTNVAIEVPRMLDSPALRAAIDAYPAANVAAIVTDDLYRDVISHGLHDLQPGQFWHVEVNVKSFHTRAWVTVDDRTHGPTDPERHLGVPPSPQPVASPQPLFVPAWTGATGIPKDRQPQPHTVQAILHQWHRAAAAPLTPDEIRIATSDTRPVLDTATQFLTSGHPQAALTTLQPWLRRAPHCGPLIIATARTLLYGGNPADHATHTRELLDWVLEHCALHLHDSTEALMLRAESAYLSADFTTAEQDLRHTLSSVPSPGHEPGPLALLRLGDCLEQLARPDEAQTTWTQLHTLRPLNPDVLLRLGHLALAAREPYVAETRFAKAAEALRRAPGTSMTTDHDALSHALSMGRYDAALARGDRDTARRHLAEAADAAPQDPFTAAAQAIEANQRGDQPRSRMHTVTAVTRAVETPRGDIVLDRLRDQNLITQQTWQQARAAHRQSFTIPTDPQTKPGHPD